MHILKKVLANVTLSEQPELWKYRSAFDYMTNEYLKSYKEYTSEHDFVILISTDLKSF